MSEQESDARTSAEGPWGQVDAEWDADGGEYGLAVSPTEWDDYSSEQSVQVAPPPPRAVPVAPEPETEPEIEPEAESETEPEAVAVAETAAEPEAVPEAEPEAEPAWEVGAAAEPAALADSWAVVVGVAEGTEAAASPDVTEVIARDAALGDEPTEVMVPEVEATEPEVATEGESPALLPEGDHEDAWVEPTQVLPEAVPPGPAWNEEAQAEEQRLREQLEAERQARDERLGVIPPLPVEAPRPPAPEVRINTDRFLGSFSLFVLRIVTAAIVGVIGYQILSDVNATADFLGRTAIPEPRLVAWILGFTLGTMAMFLVIGLLQRVVGALLLLITVGALVFVRWGAFSPFVAGREGFIGDRDLLLAAVGLVLVGLGGGLWGLDGAFRRARAEARKQKQS